MPYIYTHYMYVCMYVRTYVRMYVCMYIYMYGTTVRGGIEHKAQVQNFSPNAETPNSHKIQQRNTIRKIQQAKSNKSNHSPNSKTDGTKCGRCWFFWKSSWTMKLCNVALCSGICICLKRNESTRHRHHFHKFNKFQNLPRIIRSV